MNYFCLPEGVLLQFPTVYKAEILWKLHTSKCLQELALEVNNAAITTKLIRNLSLDL